MPDLAGIATGIAARYAPGTLATPAGTPTLSAVRSATAAPPNALGALPCVVVFPDSGDFDVANGRRAGTQDWRVQFFYAEGGAGDLARHASAILRWLVNLADAHLADITLGGTCAVVRTVSWKAGDLSYAGRAYVGAELVVRTTTREPWAPA